MKSENDEKQAQETTPKPNTSKAKREPKLISTDLTEGVLVYEVEDSDEKHASAHYVLTDVQTGKKHKAQETDGQVWVYLHREIDQFETFELSRA